MIDSMIDEADEVAWSPTIYFLITSRALLQVTTHSDRVWISMFDSGFSEKLDSARGHSVATMTVHWLMIELVAPKSEVRLEIHIIQPFDSL